MPQSRRRLYESSSVVSEGFLAHVGSSGDAFLQDVPGLSIGLAR
jgi:hypothetical protein